LGVLKAVVLGCATAVAFPETEEPIGASSRRSYTWRALQLRIHRMGEGLQPELELSCSGRLRRRLLTLLECVIAEFRVFYLLYSNKFSF
jgi:hypothetical protein